MKVPTWKIATEDTCSCERAAKRIIHMRMDDAFTLAFILRKLIWNSSYDPMTLELSTDKLFVIPELTYEDIATLTKLMNTKPNSRSNRGIRVVAGRIYKLMHAGKVDDKSETVNKIPLEDIPMLLQQLKSDFDDVTSMLSGFPVGLPEDATNKDERRRRQELWNWNNRVRTLQYNVGVDIENIECIIKERIPLEGIKEKGGAE